MSEKNPDILTLAEVAAELRTSREQVRQLCIRGKLPFVNVGLGERIQYRVRVDDLGAFKKSQKREASDAMFRHAKGRVPVPPRSYV